LPDGAILDGIHKSHMSRLNDWPPAFLFDLEKFVWWLHITELTLQKKLANVIANEQILRGPTKSVAIGEVTI